MEVTAEDVGGCGIRCRLAEAARDDGVVGHEVIDVAPVDEALLVAECCGGGQVDDLEPSTRGIRLRREDLTKLARDGVIGVAGVALIVQQALILGASGWAIGLLLILTVKDYFPRRVVLEPFNVMVLAGIIAAVCLLSSALGVRAAMKVDPATALGS